mmetsp:Transcript_11534/g.32643  ORF Transcript_11534/g.32643 Transcript_11534/m.32643 type:complete len:198 (+) Transcript_11534:77-670(+)
MGAALSQCEKSCEEPGADADEELAVEAVEEVPEDSFAGRWVTGNGNTQLIGLEGVQWSDGQATKIVKKRMGAGGTPTLMTQLHGGTYWAQLLPDGRLQWSDGDIWVREDSSGPATGMYSFLAKNDLVFDGVFVGGGAGGAPHDQGMAPHPVPELGGAVPAAKTAPATAPATAIRMEDAEVQPKPRPKRKAAPRQGGP